MNKPSSVYGSMRDPSGPKVPQVTIKTESLSMSELEANRTAELTRWLIGSEAKELANPSTQLAARNRVTRALENNSNDGYGRSMIDTYLDESEWHKTCLAVINYAISKGEKTFVELLKKYYEAWASWTIAEEDMRTAYEHIAKERKKPTHTLLITRSIRNRLTKVEIALQEKIKRELLAGIKQVEIKLVEQPGTSYKSKTDLEAMLKTFNAFIAEPDTDTSTMSDGAQIVIWYYQRILDISEAIHTEAVLYEDKLKKAHSGPTAFFKKQFTKLARLFGKKS